MGWNTYDCHAVVMEEDPRLTVHCSWNTFKGNFNQTVLRSTADLLVSTGLRDAGYSYLVLDDGWKSSSRDAEGRLQPNTTKFPDGMSDLSDYIHNKGLKFGIYSTAGSVWSLRIS